MVVAQNILLISTKERLIKMISSKSVCVGIILITLAIASSADRILFLLPIAYPSHVRVFEPLIRALGERGHEVTALSPIISPNMPSSVRQIQLITVTDLLGNLSNPFEQRRKGIFGQMMKASWWDNRIRACQKLYKNPSLYTDILHGGQQQRFDLVIVDILLNYCVLGLIPYLGAPSSIYVTPLAAPSFVSNLVGNRLPPSFVPHVALGYADRMTFVERFINTLTDLVSYIMFERLVVSKMEDVYREHLPRGDELPSVHEIQRNVSMIFINSHFILDYPRPLLPNVLEVGGMHLRAPKNLPKDLDDFLNGSGKEGFIYFSLGSIVKPNEMPEESRQVFMKVFSKLKQRVIWKWEGDGMEDAPSNVLLRKWLPQQDILGHPKAKLFLSHGGLLSTQESVHHGVPILGFPLFGDQDRNIRRADREGYAKFLEIVDLTEENLEQAIVELIKNPKYTEKVKQLSKLVRDLPETPLEKAIWNVEYLLRHRGAPHLRSVARDLNFFQYYLLDVAAMTLIGLPITFYVIWKCFKIILNCAIRGTVLNGIGDMKKNE